jgi:AcrR family transcriptional regulator
MSPARGPYRTGIEKRRLLVENAMRVFAEHGYHGGSLRIIADAVGAPASQIVNLFGSKHGLLTAVLDAWDAEQVDDSALTGLAYVNALRSRMAYSRESPTWVRFLLTLGSEATAADHPAHTYFVERYDRIAEHLGAAIQQAAADGDIAPIDRPAARVEAQLLSSMMDGLQLQWLLDPGLDLVAAFDGYLDAVLERWRADPAS